MLLNGDFRQVVKHLTWHKKTKIAMIVSQSINAISSKERLTIAVEHFYKNGQCNPVLMKILDLIADNQVNARILAWNHDFLRSLLFSSCPTAKLEEIVTEKVGLRIPSYDNNQSILWSALRLYAGVRDADNDFKEFKQGITVAHSDFYQSRDYRLKWVLQVVVRYYL